MYLLDTNIVIFYFKGNINVVNKIKLTGLSNCFISEVTVAELKIGAYKSEKYEYHNKLIEDFVKGINVISISDIIDCYASERARLEKLGQKLENFDLLIGATAIANELILVTNNLKHLQRMSITNIEDWTQ
jgi:tRNA(fMet)-specific endonuclease VapC